MLNISKAQQPSALEWLPSHLNMSPWLQIPTHFRSIGAEEPRDWLADQQQTSLLATQRGAWPGPQSRNIPPNFKKDRLLAFPLPPGASSERHKWGEWNCELGDNEDVEQIPSLEPPYSLRESTSLRTWCRPGRALFLPQPQSGPRPIAQSK